MINFSVFLLASPQLILYHNEVSLQKQPCIRFSLHSNATLLAESLRFFLYESGKPFGGRSKETLFAGYSNAREKLYDDITFKYPNFTYLNIIDKTFFFSIML